MTRKDEYYLQCQVCDYLRRQYPDVFFQSDLSGIKLPIGQAKQVKRIKFGKNWPDLFIAEPRATYHGLFLELKKNRNELFTKSGKMRSEQHIQGQWLILQTLQQKGYLAQFTCGFDETRRVIDGYLGIGNWDE